MRIMHNYLQRCIHKVCCSESQVLSHIYIEINHQKKKNFSRQSLCRGQTIKSFVNSVRGTFECLYMEPVVSSFLWGSMISREVDSIFISLYSFRTFGVLYFNLLSIYIKALPFEVGNRFIVLQIEYLIKRFYFFLVYTYWFQVLWTCLENVLPDTSDHQSSMEGKKY